MSSSQSSVFSRYRVCHCDEFVKPQKEYDAIFSVNENVVVVVLICFLCCSCCF